MFLYFRLIVMSLLQMREQVDDEENDDEDMGVAETYSDYMPPKCKLLSGFQISRKLNKTFKFVCGLLPAPSRCFLYYFSPDFQIRPK